MKVARHEMPGNVALSSQPRTERCDGPASVCSSFGRVQTMAGTSASKKSRTIFGGARLPKSQVFEQG
jgi:hypothetical protein